MKGSMRIINLVLFIILGFVSDLWSLDSTVPTLIPTVALIALYVGLILGTLMILVVLINYVKHQKINPGGIIILVFGVILLGMSIWQQIEFTVGGIKFKALTQEYAKIQAVQDSTTKTLNQLQQVKASIDQELGEINTLVGNIPNSSLRNNILIKTQNITNGTVAMAGYIQKVETNRDTTQSRLNKIKGLTTLPRSFLQRP